MLRIKSVNRLIIGHLNINFISGKFDQLKSLIEKNIDVLILIETKMNASFPNPQCIIDGYSPPFRHGSNWFGGVPIYIRDDIPCKELSEHNFPVDSEEIFIEINLRKTEWLILGTYHPPNQSIDYFFENVGKALDIYSQKYHKFLLYGDFNSEYTESRLSEFLLKFDSKNLVMEKTCFENPENPRCIDLFLTNSVQNFQNISVFAIGMSDFHKMILTVLKTSFPKSASKKILYRNYKNFNTNSYKNDLKKQLKYTESYESFETCF